jgi:hypothetical protein
MEYYCDDAFDFWREVLNGSSTEIKWKIVGKVERLEG